MKKFDTFLENIGLKNIATGEKKPLGKILGIIAIVVVAIIAMIVGNNWISSFGKDDDNQDIVFNLKGDPTMVLYLDQEYNEPGYEAINASGKDVSDKVEVIGKVDVSTPGVYDISYRLNLNGKFYLRNRTVTIVDKSKAIFMLLGETEIELKKGEKYNEEGYFLILPGESDPNKYVTVTGTVDENVPGIYRITYTLDHSTLKHELTRTINVIGESNLMPTIILVGSQSQTLNINEKYEEKGFTAFDSIDGDLTDKVVVTNNIREGLSGIYEVKYTVKNSRGFEASVSRIIRVLEKNESGDSIKTYGYLDDYLNVVASNKALTKDNVTLDISVISSDVKAIILPDNTITTSKNLKYTIKENGTYIIVVELNDGTLINGSIVIDNIDKVAPTGTCQAVYKDGKVSFAVNASDSDALVELRYDDKNDYSKCLDSSNAPDYCFDFATSDGSYGTSSGVEGFSYYNGEVYSDFINKNVYEVSTNKQSGYKVILKDKIGNTSQIDCTSQTLSAVTAIKIIGESKAKLGDEVLLQVVFTPINVTNRDVKWEIIEGSDFGKINDGGLVKITDDGRYLDKTDNYIIVKATSLDGGLTATHKISVYLDEKRLNESGAAANGEGSTWNGGKTALLQGVNGIKIRVGETYDIDVREWKDKKVTLRSSDPEIVSVNGYQIKGEKLGNAKLEIIDEDNNVLKFHDVAVIKASCGKSPQTVTLTYSICENREGKIVCGIGTKTPDNSSVTIGKTQSLKVRAELTEECGEIIKVWRITPDGVTKWGNYFEQNTIPYIERWYEDTWQKLSEFTWYITPKSKTNGYIQLSLTVQQITTAFQEIKSFANLHVKVVDESVDIGVIGSIIIGPAAIGAVVSQHQQTAIK